MFKIFKAEFDYNKFAFLGALSFVIPICILEAMLDDLPNFYIIVPMFWIGLYWIMIRNKETREFYFVHLPLSRCKLALVRIGMIILYSFIIIGFYELIHFIFQFRGSANYPVSIRNLVTYFAIVLFIFSTYFIVRDLILFFLRSNRFFKLKKEQSKTILLFAMLLVNILGVFALVVQPTLIGKIFEFFIHDNPFADVNNVIRFSAISLALAFLSIVSYNRRKAYLE
jgi:hypothetical protein